MSKIKSSRQRRKEASRRNYLSKHGKTWESQFSLSPSRSSNNGPWRSVSSERTKSSNSKTRKRGRGIGIGRGRGIGIGRN